MTLNQILLALNGQPDHDDPAALARMGFLEWVGSAPPDFDPPRAARAAMIHMHGFIANAPAVGHFRALLRSAAQPLPHPRRRGGRRRMLH